VDVPLWVEDSGDIMLNSWSNIGGGGGYHDGNDWVYMPGALIRNCIMVELTAGHIGGLDGGDGDGVSYPAVLIEDSAQVIIGSAVQFEGAFSTPVGVWNSERCRLFYSIDLFGSNFKNVDGLHLAGTTTGTMIQTSVMRPNTSGTPPHSPRYAINDESTGGNNHAIGNDFGNPAHYTASPIVNGPIILTLPSDPTYGDNFTQ